LLQDLPPIRDDRMVLRCCPHEGWWPNTGHSDCVHRKGSGRLPISFTLFWARDPAGLTLVRVGS